MTLIHASMCTMDAFAGLRSEHSVSVIRWGSTTPQSAEGDGLRRDQDPTAGGGRAISLPLPLWLDAGYRGEDKGADWVQKTLDWSVDLLERPRKPAPEEVLMRWAREWAKEGLGEN